MRGYKQFAGMFPLLLFLCCQTGCSQLQETEKMNPGVETVETGGICYELADHDTYAYDSLTEEEKIWYDAMNNLLAYRSDAQIELDRHGIDAGFDEDTLDRIYQCVLIDHPEYFYVDGYEYTRYTRRDELVGIKIKACYTMEKSECEEKKAQIEEAAEQLLSQIPTDAEDYQKIKFVYETIILQTEYDLEAPQNQNIYSVFVGRASVCQGYAKATQYLLNRLGVKCTLIFGEVEEKEPHAWNMVECNGEYYYLDTTWGDASYMVKGQTDEQEDTPGIKYDYLCINEEQLALTHRLCHDVDLPRCTATKDNYYRREGCYFQSFDEAQLEREIQEMLRNSQEMVTLKCESAELYEEMSRELIGAQRIFEYLDTSYTSVAYLQEEERLTLTFWVTK